MQTDIAPLMSVSDNSPSWGEALRQARLAQQLSEIEVASKLKLSVQQIVAMEAEALLAVHESPVFARGYVNNYAKLLGVNLAYKQSTQQTEQEKLVSIDLVGEQFAHGVKSSKKGFWWLFAVLLLSVLVWQFVVDAQLMVLVNK